MIRCHTTLVLAPNAPLQLRLGLLRRWFGGCSTGGTCSCPLASSSTRCSRRACSDLRSPASFMQGCPNANRHRVLGSKVFLGMLRNAQQSHQLCTLQQPRACTHLVSSLVRDDGLFALLEMLQFDALIVMGDGQQAGLLRVGISIALKYVPHTATHTRTFRARHGMAT